MHGLDYCHRDLKPENILVHIKSQKPDANVTNQFKATMPITPEEVIVKICDLGLVREHNNKEKYFYSF